MILEKQNSRLLTLLGILVVLLTTGLFFYFNQQKTKAGDIDLYQRFLAQDARANEIHFKHMKGMVKQLAQNRSIQHALDGEHHKPKAAVTDELFADINTDLLHLAHIQSISAALILNTDGRCVLASAPSFLGENYSLSPYFRQAMVEEYGLSLAEGGGAQQLGIYYALPIYKESQILGVAVLKFLPSFFQVHPLVPLTVARPQEDQVLVGVAVANGVLMGHPNQRLYSLSAVTDEKRLQITGSSHVSLADIVSLGFPDGTWENLVQTGYLQVQNQVKHKKYHIFTAPLVGNDLFILHLIEDSWFTLAYSQLGQTQQNLLFVLYGTVFILILCLAELGRRYHLFRKTSSELIDEKDKHNQALVLYQFIVNNSPIAFWQVDPETQRVTMVNEAFCQLLKQDKETLIGRSIFDFYSESGLEIIRRKSFQINMGTVIDFETELQYGNEVHVPVLQHSQFVLDPVCQKKQQFAFFTDIGTIKSQQEELNLFNLALDQSDNSIVITDAAGDIEYVNQALLDLTGYTRAELIGENARIFKSEVHSDVFYEKMWNTLGAGKTWRDKICNKRKDGSTFWEDSTISPITKASGEISHYLGIKIDITKEIELEEKLRQALKDAEAATVAKSYFLANMSHEIRTPMNGIIGMTRLALGTNLDEKQAHYLNNIMLSATGLLHLLNDILDFSKIEAHQLLLENRNFSLHTLLRTVLINFQVIAEEKGIELVDDTDYLSVPNFVIGDELRLRQILTNLVGNALKFTQQGRVAVGICLQERGENTRTLEFYVSDTGIGIPAQELEAIFANFSQVDSSTARQYGGTGLGLSISQQLVELMGGRLEVTSCVGQGSRFFFTITMQCGSELPSAQEFVLDTKKFNLRLLLVEDNSLNQEIAQTVLERMGCQVAVAGNGFEALTCLVEKEFDVILLDIQMPVLDGYCTAHFIRFLEEDPGFKIEGVCTKRDAASIKTTPCYASEVVGFDLLEKLKEKLKGKHNYIVAMTANAMPGDKEKCLAIGMDDYLTKPFQPEDVMMILDQFKLQPVPSGTSRNVVPGPAGMSLREQAAAHLSHAYMLNDEQVELLLKKSVEVLKQELKALSLAWDTQDSSLLHQAAHKIKGCCLNLGLAAASEQAQELESAALQGVHPPSQQMLDVFISQIQEFILSEEGLPK